MAFKGTILKVTYAAAVKVPSRDTRRPVIQKKLGLSLFSNILSVESTAGEKGVGLYVFVFIPHTLSDVPQRGCFGFVPTHAREK